MKRSSNLIILLLFFTLIFPKGLFSQYRKRIDSILLSLEHVVADTTKINSLNQLSIEFQKVNLDSARLFAKRALTLSEKTNYAAGKGFALNNIGSCYYMQSDLDTALSYYEKAHCRIQSLIKLDKTAGVNTSALDVIS